MASFSPKIKWRLENMKAQKLKNNQISEYELIKGHNGISIFSEWHQSEEPEDYSRAEIAKSYRLRREY